MLLSTIHIVPTGPPIGKMTGDTLHAIFEDQNIDSWIDSMRSKEFLNTQQMFVEFKSYPYLDDLLIDPILIDHFEKFMVNWMELKQQFSLPLFHLLKFQVKYWCILMVT